jgi:hypothetical protein
VRDELERARRTVGDTAWTTALHEIADQAWRAGWDAADEATSEHATITLRTAIGRATNAALDRLGIDEDQREAVVDSAEAAARESLTRAALQGRWDAVPGEGPSEEQATDDAAEPEVKEFEAGEHPWDAARRAARAASGGHAWGTIMDIARDALDESSWETAMAAARRAVDHVLHDAPDMVARTVAASVAREAASAAARSVALRAAAVARAHGSPESVAAEAAETALAATTAELQQSAIDLLDRMISPST